MSLVGFDPELLLALRLAVRRAADELLALRCGDPAAADAIATIDTARRDLTDRWEPLVQRVLASGALTDTIWLGGALPDIGLDDDEFEALLADLGLAVPTWSTGFDDWSSLCRSLGDERMAVAQALVDDPENPDLRRRLDDLDAALVTVAERYAAGPHDGHVRWWPVLLDSVDPYTGALMLSGLGLDEHELGTEAARLLGRERDQQPGGVPWSDVFAGGDNAGDLVFELLAAHPLAAGVFLDAAAQRPEIVFRTAERDETVAAVLAAGTDPTDVDAVTAGRRLRPLLEWAIEFGVGQGTGDGITSALPVVLAGAMTPWLLQFGARADEWNWDDDQADDALRWVVADDLAVDAIVNAMSTWRDSMGTDPLVLPDGRVDLARLDELATMFDQVGRAVRDAGIDDAAEARWFAEAGVFVTALFLSAVVPGGVLVSMAADATLAAAAPMATAKLAGWGLLPSAGAAEVAARSGFGLWMTDAAVAAVVSVAAESIAAGRMPVDALDELDLDDLADAAADGDCATEAVVDRLHRWIVDVSPRCDPVTQNALSTVLASFTNRSTVSEACGR